MTNKAATPAVKIALILTLSQVALFFVVIAVYGSMGRPPFLYFKYDTVFDILPTNIFLLAVPVQAVISIPIFRFYRSQFGLSWIKYVAYCVTFALLMSFMVATTGSAAIINEKYIKRASSHSSVEFIGVARSQLFTRYGTSRLFCSKLLRISLESNPDEVRTLCADTLLQLRMSDVEVGARMHFEALETPYGYLLTSMKVERRLRRHCAKQSLEESITVPPYQLH